MAKGTALPAGSGLLAGATGTGQRLLGFFDLFDDQQMCEVAPRVSFRISNMILVRTFRLLFNPGGSVDLTSPSSCRRLIRNQWSPAGGWRRQHLIGQLLRCSHPSAGGERPHTDEAGRHLEVQGGNVDVRFIRF